ncbi:hypothetical protein ACFDR9_003714 [Janthinobacterium sp. CG_23.3]|uniref:hypothetical protein n=1 Tax=Janthinobacterium sp. CG_23.3 TaxID=3349634 RepID=UPI0038D3F96E
MISHQSAAIRIARRFLAGACLTLPMLGHGKNEQAALSVVAQRHGECLRPSFGVGELVSISKDVFGGYGIEVQGERYWATVPQRMTYQLLSQDGAEVVARVNLDRPPVAEFDEQARWRVRWLEDIAERAGVALNRQSLRDGAQLLTVNKDELKGQFAGMSMLVDPRHRSFVQWDWHILPRYTGAQDVVATQSDVWGKLMPCLLKP